MSNNVVLKEAKKMVPQKIRRKIKSKIYFSRLKRLKRESKSKAIFLVGTPLHGNLGDQAITIAEIKFFKDYFPEHRVIEVPSAIVREGINELKKIISSELICIHGGGFLGTLWETEEEMARSIIKNFPNNKIIILPQTIYYENTDHGKQYLEVSEKTYGAHNNLFLCAREKNSYEIMKRTYHKNRILLIPDIVTYLDESDLESQRIGVLLCIRSDKESTLDEGNKKALFDMAKNICSNIKMTDTVLPISIKENDREKYLTEKLDEFRNAKLVITDRLHGMIFAAITGTPCIAMNNSSGKVAGVYEWIKHLNYIEYVENIDEVHQHVEKLMGLKGCRYDKNQVMPYFDVLKNLIKEEI